MTKAVQLLARTEGILVDQFTPEAFAGLLDLISKGYFKREKCSVCSLEVHQPSLLTWKIFLKINFTVSSNKASNQ